MKVSRNWLQNYFETSLPSVEEISDALTFHAFEIEEVVGDDLIDVNILPDRAADCLSHRGIAREIGAILDMPAKADALREPAPKFPGTDKLVVSVEDDTKCARYVGAYVRGVKVGPSPAWLKQALEAVGQRSINNVVDATNYVMLNIGQPLHAFDAAMLEEKDGAYAIRVRGASADEKITTLTGEEFSVPEGTLLITDANSNAPIGIAGVKGGKAAGITESTTDIIVESANFDGSLVRKASQKLKLWTDASQRFQNKISPELAGYGMKEVLDLIQQIAGGQLDGVVDIYADAASSVEPTSVPVSLEKINGLLGSSYDASDVENVFNRLEFSYTNENDVFTVTPPFERRDITLSESIVKEVGRVLGYDLIEPVLLPTLENAPDQDRYKGIERIKDFLVERGFTEISTQTFAVAGEKVLANPLDQTRPALRAGLSENMQAALARAVSVAPRVLGPATEVKLFEIGTVFKKDSEHLALALGYKLLSGKQSTALLQQTMDDLEQELVGAFATKPVLVDQGVIEAVLTDTNLEMLGAGYEPTKVTLGAYKPFSIYPFALRDIAVWTPDLTEEDEVVSIIIHEAGPLLARIDLFDRFSKETDGVDRISYAFRLVFESSERTLSDEDLNPLMEKVTAALNAKQNIKGQRWEVR
jgi:phenylalanyl-tRNA synthetase beta chain